MQELVKTVKGNRHPYYDRVTKLSDKYLPLMTGEGIDELLKQFNPREDDEMFKQRKRITKSIVGGVSGKIKSPFEKVARSNNVTKKFMYRDEKKEGKLLKLEEVIEKYWGDENLDQYMEDRIIDLAFSDPNAFIVTESQTINNEGDIEVFPFEVSSHEAVNYYYSNNKLIYLVVFDGHRKYTLYTDSFHVVLIERKDKSKKEEENIVVPGLDITNNIDSEQPPEEVESDEQLKIEIGNKVFEMHFIENICNEIPAIRIGYKRDEVTLGNTYVSPMHKAIPRLEKIIKSDSELDLVISLHAFPQKLQYAQRCEGDIPNNQICDGGTIRGTNDTCPKCGGTGFIFHTTTQDAITYEFPSQDELNAGANVPDLDKLITYKHPPIEIIEFENKYTRQLEDEAVKDVFQSQNFERSNGTATATEIEYDMDSIYDTLYPFARKFSAIYKKQVRLTACLMELDEGLTVVHKFPKDFKLKTISQLLAERKAAEDANAPEFFKTQLDRDIAMKVYHDDPNALKKFLAKQDHLPFPGKTKDQIKDIIMRGDSTKENITLWVEFENIMRDLEDDTFLNQGADFYSLPYSERKQMIQLKVQQIIEDKANESNIGELKLDGDQIETPVDVEAEAKAKLKGTVGGVQGIIEINQAVADGNMSETSAEKLLVQLYGFDIEIAQQLIEPVGKLSIPGQETPPAQENE